MASVDDAIKALSALSNHCQVIVDAYLNNHGSITYSDETKSAIDALKKYRLVWHHPEDDSAQLSGSLNKLLDNSLRNYRRQMANEVIAGLLEHLQSHLIVDYGEAKKRCLIEDSRRIKGEINECVYDLIEQITESVIMFAQYLSGGFTYVTDLELRIRENERVINMARKLNDILEEFDLMELDRLAGRDHEIGRLLSRLLPQAIEQAQSELVQTLHQLAIMLNATREGADRSRLIGVFVKAYSDKSFSPSLDGLTKIPHTLNRVSINPILPFVDVLDASAELILYELCQDSHKSIEDETINDELVDITDATDLPEEAVPIDNISFAADDVIRTILSEGIAISASEARIALEITCSHDLWMCSLMGSISTLNTEDLANIRVKYVEDIDPVYTNNQHVKDLILESGHAY